MFLGIEYMYAGLRSQYQPQILLKKRCFRAVCHIFGGLSTLKNLQFLLDFDWRLGYIFSENSTKSAKTDL